MRNYKRIVILFVLIGSLTACVLLADSKGTLPGAGKPESRISTEDNPSRTREYKIKAAFLYNFVKTIEWPEAGTSSKKQPIIIGIIGKDLFGDSFKPIDGQTVKNRKIQIQRFKGFSNYPKNQKGLSDVPKKQVQALTQCHILFICESEKDVFRELLRITDHRPLLTVSEIDQFLESGGMINFIPGASKGDFEINLAEIEKEKLEVSSKLLRIAKRVIKKEQEEKK